MFTTGGAVLFKPVLVEVTLIVNLPRVAEPGLVLLLLLLPPEPTA
jgi:hypothetical protein